jgi:NADH-quinone oxidoreductase subunit J
MGELLVFYAFAFVAIVSAVGVIAARHPVYSALLLVLNFFCLAAFYILLQAEFLAAIQVIVYAGAIMVLFVFVIMFLSPAREADIMGQMRGLRLLAVPLVLLFLGEALFVAASGTLGSSGSTAQATSEYGGSVQAIGHVLFTDYIFPFEVTSLLLLVAMVGAIVLAKRRG